MGITAHSLTLLERALTHTEVKIVIELGAQNLYDNDHYGLYADVWYKKKGIEYACIDLSKENGAIQVDLREPFYVGKVFDLVTDFGTSEHIGTQGKHDIKAFYQCWKSKHEMLKVGGVMVNENPKTGNWPGHGFNYYTKEFYNSLIPAMGYELIEIGETAAMGNTESGWNIYCSFKKVNDNPFMSLAEFKKLGICTQ